MERLRPALYAAIIVQFIVASAGGKTLPSSQPAALPKAGGAYVDAGSVAAPDATQAAAADERFVYAISSTAIAKHDRTTGELLGKSTGRAEHLNSGYLWQGKLYCAHSNFPHKPDQSDIRLLDPATMALTVFHTFADPPGSLTWAVRRGDSWWCHFAHYGKDNAASVLVEFDDKWQEVGRWTSPPELVAEWGNYSLSGGIWQGDDLLATGHDRRSIYRLRVPRQGKVVEVVEVIPSPFPGQGIAADPKTGGLVGIDRGGGRVLFARYETR